MSRSLLRERAQKVDTKCDWSFSTVARTISQKIAAHFYPAVTLSFICSENLCLRSLTNYITFAIAHLARVCLATKRKAPFLAFFAYKHTHKKHNSQLLLFLLLDFVRRKEQSETDAIYSRIDFPQPISAKISFAEDLTQCYAVYEKAILWAWKWSTADNTRKWCAKMNYANPRVPQKSWN